VPSLFRRKSDDLVTDTVTEATTRTTPSGAAKAAGAKSAVTKATTTKLAGSKLAAATRAGAAKPATKATSLKSTTLKAPADESTSDTAARSRAHTTSKKDLGRSTPKRKAGGRTPEPPPANRREAMKRQRAKEREARAEARAGMMAGKEEYLPRRDQGPERGLVRDIVDSRHSVSRAFMPAALGLVLITSGSVPVPLRLFGTYAFYILIAAVIADSVLLSLKIKKMLRERFPKSALPPRSHYFYGIMRALSIRKLRMPQPKVKVGQKI
jgi:hypothetical protein